MFRTSRVALVLVAVLAVNPARAGILPTTVTVTPEAGNFRWTYAVVLPSDMKLQAGDYFGIYNFHGLIEEGSGAPDGWTLSTPTVSPLPPNVTIFDDPSAPNLIWTYNGPTIPAGQLGLGNFWASSQYGAGEQSLFVGRNARSGDGIYDTNITEVMVPTGAPRAFRSPRRSHSSRSVYRWSGSGAGASAGNKSSSNNKRCGPRIISPTHGIPVVYFLTWGVEGSRQRPPCCASAFGLLVQLRIAACTQVPRSQKDR